MIENAQNKTLIEFIGKEGKFFESEIDTTAYLEIIEPNQLLHFL